MGAAAALIFFSPFASHRYPAKRVAVLPFENQTGDSSLNPVGRIVEEWIMQSLLQSGLAEVIPRERLLDIEGPRNIRSLARATGAGTFVSGSYYKLGETIQLQAQVTDANGEQVLGTIEPVGGPANLDESLSFPLQSSTPGTSMQIAAAELRAHGHADAALSILDRAIQWYKSRPPDEAHKLRLGLASTLYDARRWEEARTLYDTLARESPEDIDNQEMLGLIAARQGDREKAMKTSEWLQNLKKPYLFGDPTYTRACIAAVLGERDQAVALLRDSFLQGVGMNVSLHADPDFESLWDYPSFQELMKPKG